MKDEERQEMLNKYRHVIDEFYSRYETIKEEGKEKSKVEIEKEKYNTTSNANER